MGDRGSRLVSVACVAEAPRYSVYPEYKRGHWSFFPCCLFLLSCEFHRFTTDDDDESCIRAKMLGFHRCPPHTHSSALSLVQCVLQLCALNVSAILIQLYCKDGSDVVLVSIVLSLSSPPPPLPFPPPSPPLLLTLPSPHLTCTLYRGLQQVCEIEWRCCGHRSECASPSQQACDQDH